MNGIKLSISVSVIFSLCASVFANNEPPASDTLRSQFLEEVVVTSAAKETNQLKKLPGSVTVISQVQLDGMQIEGMKDISTLVPNFYVPDYGSKMTSPVYIRGVGNRSTGQATGMYVDNVPLLNKSMYDFDFVDVQRVELLRGPQGTLYGRNAMGGILNVFTHSPLQFAQKKLLLTAGNYGLWRAKASADFALNQQTGLSVGGYYDRNDGYFTNEYSGKKADELEAAGGHFRIESLLSESLKASFIVDYDFSDQGAFPYGLYDKTTGVLNPVNYNDEGDYLRRMGYTALNLEYKNQKVLLSSTTSYQGLNDNMYMDQDYSAQDIYNITQQQRQQAVTEELTIKSNTARNYQWLFGAYGFYNGLKTDVTVNLKKMGVMGMIQPMLRQIGAARGEQIAVLDTSILNPGTFDTPDYGGAVFHQSTYNNLFIEGLSVTAGIRLDYEEVLMDYHSSMGFDARFQSLDGSYPPYTATLDTVLCGSESLHFVQVLPKIALKYEWNDRHYVYASASKGYNPGGFNIQTLSEISMMSVFSQLTPSKPATDMKEATAYDPEYSWNYEIGYKGEVIKNVLSAEAALFYIDIEDMQLTKFVSTGAGRMITNAGKAVSKGVDVSLNARILPGLQVGCNYGYAHATFKDYHNGKTDFSGKYLPYTPQQTFSLYGAYMHAFKNAIIDRLSIHGQYNGAGKIYWNEANDATQDFYGLLNLKAGVSKGIFSLNLWAQNLLDTDYSTFYFEMQGKSFMQQGKPATFGADLVLTF